MTPLDDPLRWLSRLAESAHWPSPPLFGYHQVPPGWSVDLASGLPEHLVYFVVAGSCQGVVGGRRIRLRPGGVLWVWPRTAFRLQLMDPARPITLYRFRLAVGEAPAGEPRSGEATGEVVLPDAWELRGTFDLLISELAGSLPLRDQRVRGLLTVLFAGILRLAERGEGAGRVLTQAQRRRLEDHADARVADRPTPDELAAVVGLSSDYFARRFRRTFGVAPRAWLVRRRIAQAALRLDESRDSITRIAEDLGYPDVFLFSRQFKSVMGMPPSAYRLR